MASRCRMKEFEGYRKAKHAEPQRRGGTTVAMSDMSGRGDVEVAILLSILRPPTCVLLQDPFIQETRNPQWTSIVDNVKFKFTDLTAQCILRSAPLLLGLIAECCSARAGWVAQEDYDAIQFLEF